VESGDGVQDASIFSGFGDLILTSIGLPGASKAGAAGGLGALEYCEGRVLLCYYGLGNGCSLCARCSGGVFYTSTAPWSKMRVGTLQPVFHRQTSQTAIPLEA
jgi:hypothetical protein